MLFQSMKTQFYDTIWTELNELLYILNVSLFSKDNFILFLKYLNYIYNFNDLTNCFIMTLICYEPLFDSDLTYFANIRINIWLIIDCQKPLHDR